MPVVRLRDVDIYYEVHGEGEWVVFVNGLLADITSWTSVVARFSDFRILLYDCRGQGRSGKPEGIYFLEEHEKDLIALLEFLGIKKAFFIGLSSGGALILRLIAGRPELVKGAVVAGSYAKVDSILWFKLDAWAEAARVSSSLRFKVALPMVWGRWFLEEKRNVLDEFRRKAEVFPNEVAWKLIEGAKYQDVLRGLRGKENPVLFVVGEEDILTPFRYSAEAANLMRNYRIEIIERAGHACTIERPDKFSDMALSFIKTV